MRYPTSLGAAAALAFGLVGHSRVEAQSSPTAFTSFTRYDAFRRVVGTIEVDPDGGGPIGFAAVRYTYDANGRLVETETGELSSWQSDAVAPASWSGFAVYTILETGYDAVGRKTREIVRGSDNAAVSITEYSYDSLGRRECTAQRMNTSVWGTPLPNTCVPGAAGSHGPDRITKNIYDAAGQLLQVREGVGSTVEAAEVTYTYTNNGKIKFVIDANGNKAELRYDGHDRQVRWVFPSTTKPSAFNDSTPANAVATAGALNEADYELYGYDANGNRTSLRKRDGSSLTYQYDALNRMTRKTVPDRSDLAATHERDVFYGYDLRGLQLSIRFDSTSGEGLTNVWDGLGRLTSATVNLDNQSRQLSHLYDLNGNRTRITFPDTATYFTYAYDALDRLQTVSNSAATELVSPAYNGRGLVASAARYSSAHDQSFTYDTASRLAGLGIAGGQTASAVGWTFTRNPASQLLTEARDNDSYAWAGQVAANRNYAANGLNQYTAAGSAAFCFDANGNLTADGTSVYKYDVENRLVEKRAQGAGNTNCAALSYAGALQATMRYDPLGRLHEVGGAGGAIAARFLHDGDALAGEYTSAGTLLRRFVHGADAGTDDPLLWFEGAGTSYTDARHLYADPRGSVVLVGNSAGAAIALNSYDEYGIPGSANQGRFQYTGQAWLPEFGLYHYKARIYSPTLGRFMQTDPIGYEDQFNLYAYVGNDPVNRVDPSGTYTCAEDKPCEEIVESYRDEMFNARDAFDSGSEDYARIDASISNLGEPGEAGIVVNDKGSDPDNPSLSGIYSNGELTIYSDSIASHAQGAAVETAELGAAVLAHELDTGHMANLTTRDDRMAAEISGYTTEDAVHRGLGNAVGTNYRGFGAAPDRETRIRNAAERSIAASCRNGGGAC